MEITKRIVEEITIIYTEAESDQASAYLADHGYEMITSGPVRVETWKIHPTDYYMIGEKEISDVSQINPGSG